MREKRQVYEHRENKDIPIYVSKLKINDWQIFIENYLIYEFIISSFVRILYLSSLISISPIQFSSTISYSIINVPTNILNDIHLYSFAIYI